MSAGGFILAAREFYLWGLAPGWYQLGGFVVGAVGIGMMLYRHGVLIADDAHPAKASTKARDIRRLILIAFEEAGRLGIHAPGVPVGYNGEIGSAEHVRRFGEWTRSTHDALKKYGAGYAKHFGQPTAPSSWGDMFADGGIRVRRLSHLLKELEEGI